MDGRLGIEEKEENVIVSRAQGPTNWRYDDKGWRKVAYLAIMEDIQKYMTPIAHTVNKISAFLVKQKCITPQHKTLPYACIYIACKSKDTHYFVDCLQRKFKVRKRRIRKKKTRICVRLKNSRI